MRGMLLAAMLLAAPGAAHADALRHAALAALMARENVSPEGRRAALDAAFDSAALRAGSAEGPTQSPPRRRRNWFPKGAQPEEGWARPSVPELRLAAPEPGLGARAAGSLRAALAPWRALADAAWGGAWTGMVAVGLAETH